MERRRFGPTAVKIPVIGQGTWYIDKANRGAAVAALRLGLDLGMTPIDTAEYYGEAEHIVGEAIAGRRADVFLVSKWCRNMQRGQALSWPASIRSRA